MLKTFAVAYYNNFDAELDVFFVKAKTPLAAHARAYIHINKIDIGTSKLTPFDHEMINAESIEVFQNLLSEEEQLVIKEVP